MNAVQKITRTYRLPKRYRITFTVQLIAGQPYGFNANWEPALPPRGKYFRKHLEKPYTNARQKFMELLAKELGGTVAVMEVSK